MRKEINRLEIVMPETKFPEWFDYHEEGGIPEFWARGKLPLVAIAFVFEKVKYEGVGLQVLVDGKHVHGQRKKYLHNLSVAEDHLLLCDLRVLLSDEDWKGVDTRFRHDDDWKCVNVKYETEMILRFWGVYVYKQETNMDDIQFTSLETYFTLGSAAFALGLGRSVLPSSSESLQTGVKSTQDNARMVKRNWEKGEITLSGMLSSFEPQTKSRRIPPPLQRRRRAGAPRQESIEIAASRQLPPPPPPESLQTVVGNLKRIMAVSSDEEASESESDA